MNKRSGEYPTTNAGRQVLLGFEKWICIYFSSKEPEMKWLLSKCVYKKRYYASRKPPPSLKGCLGCRSQVDGDAL